MSSAPLPILLLIEKEQDKGKGKEQTLCFAATAPQRSNRRLWGCCGRFQRVRRLPHFLASELKGNLASLILELPSQALGKETWGGPLEDTYHIWCRMSDCNGFCSWHSSTAALLSRMRPSSLWASSGKVSTAWLGSWTPWATILDQNTKGPCVL